MFQAEGTPGVKSLRGRIPGTLEALCRVWGRKVEADNFRDGREGLRTWRTIVRRWLLLWVNEESLGNLEQRGDII